jgi:predicted AAA+ superfamily ATPase
MRKILKRQFELNLPAGKSAFLWGPRKVGKSYWINQHLSQAPLIDLLMTDVYADFASRPSILREQYLQHQGLIVIDEIQKVPALLDEVHWLIENRGLSFLLTGSSARKLRRGHANLLGGRAWRRNMFPLIFNEVEGFILEEVLISGLLPPHFLSTRPEEELRSYISDYLKEEIAAEARIQNIPSFAEFLKVAAVISSALLNYTNVAREAGISQKTVRTYFNILEDTLLGFRIQPWKESKKRRMILAEKFYLFDVGVANFLMNRRPKIGSPEFGKSFEHYILMELRAYQGYEAPDLDLTYWRTSSGQEIDFIFGDKQLAIEIKGSPRVHEGDLKNFKALLEDGPVKKCIVVCLEKQPRILENKIEVLPWKIFLKRLWNHELISA